MAFNQPYQQNFTNVLSEDEFLSIIEPPPPQTPPIDEPFVFNEDEFLSLLEPSPPTIPLGTGGGIPPRDKDDETREAEETKDALDEELERQNRIDEENRRRERRRTPQQLEEARRRHEEEIDRARVRIRLNPLQGLEVSSRDRILTRVNTPFSRVRQPQNITIAEPARTMEQQYYANSLPRARARRPQRGLYF